MNKDSRSPATLSDAISLARRLGAGRLVWGHVATAGGTFAARVELYDVSQPSSSLKEITVDPNGGSTGYAAAVVQLLAPPDRPVAASGGDELTHSYTAWAAYNRGHGALANWNLDSAQTEFEHAVAADPNFPVAHLWLGQVLEWRSPFASDTWREHAERAAGDARKMSTRDRLAAVALASMGMKHFPAACDAYRSLTRLDSLDYLGWYGLGECQGLDREVIADESSPSGWRFRSSYDAAVKSYDHALRLEPGAHALLSFERLRRLLPTAATNLRTDDSSNPRFGAYPSLSGNDTLAFVPYPLVTIANGLPPTATKTLNRALEHDLDVLFALARRWVKVDPRNPDAYESLADVLESRGDIDGDDGITASAVAAIREARRISTDSHQQLRLAVREGRLRFRRGDYVGTNAMADSLLAVHNVTDDSDRGVLITLAALTGRVSAMARLARGDAVPVRLGGIAISPSVIDAASNLFAVSALGVCGDTLTVLRQRVEQQIQSSIAEEQRPAVRLALEARSLSMMAPCTSGMSALAIVYPNKLQRIQQSLAKRDIAAVNTGLREVAVTRRPLRPTDWSIDYIYQEAWIRAAIGDTAAAISELDRSLNTIAALSTPALNEPAASAAVGRAMTLRADLAAATGDVTSARRWSKAVAMLWRGADPPLQKTVARMKTLSASR